jgi:hypothetical protein
MSLYAPHRRKREDKHLPSLDFLELLLHYRFNAKMPRRRSSHAFRFSNKEEGLLVVTPPPRARWHCMVSMLGLLFAVTIVPHAAAAATIVEQDSGEEGICPPPSASCSASVTFSSVTSEDVLVVAAFDADSNSPGISDTLGSSYSTLGSNAVTGLEVVVYATTLGSGGSDKITVSDSSGLSTGIWLTAFELIGVTTTGATSATGSGTGTGSISTSQSLSFQSGAFLLGLMSCDSCTFSQGTGFSGFSQPVVSYAYEYATSGVSSPTDFPASFSSVSEHWEEVGVQLPPVQVFTVTETVTSTRLLRIRLLR